MKTVFYKDGTTCTYEPLIEALGKSMSEGIDFEKEGDARDEYEFIDGKWKPV